MAKFNKLFLLHQSVIGRRVYDCVNKMKFRIQTIILPQLLSTVVILVWLFSSATLDVDFQDGGHYINSIAYPYEYRYTVTLFGFVYHPIYLLFDGNIWLLRLTNIIITFLLSCIFVKLLLELFIFPKETSKLIVWVMALGLSSLSLLLFGVWFYWVTPSYNSLCFQSIVIVMIGWLYQEKYSSYSSIFIISVGMLLLFFAKATSLLPLSLLSLAFIVLRGRMSFLFLVRFVIAFFLVFLLGVLLVDGWNFYQFFERLRKGYEFVQVQASGHTVLKSFRLDRFSFNELSLHIFVFIFVFVFLISLFDRIFVKSNIVIQTKSMLGFFVVFAFVFMQNHMDIKLNLNLFRQVLVLALPISLFVYVVFYKIFYAPSIDVNNFLKTVVVAIFLFVVPHIFSFGTKGNYWMYGSAASLFWVLSGLVFIRLLPSEMRVQMVFSTVLVSQIMVIFFLGYVISNPYVHLGSRKEWKSEIVIRNKNSFITVSEEFSNYINGAQNKSAGVGMKLNTPILDLTGHSPWLIYTIGGYNLGVPWLIGGYQGSQNAARFVVNQESCGKLSKTWLLIDDSWRSLSVKDTLAAFGVSLKSYQLKTSWIEPKGTQYLAKGQKNIEREQRLYGPISPQDIAQSCNNYRAALLLNGA